MNLQRRLMLGVLGGLGFLVNPALLTGCASKFEFDEQDMKEELERISATEWHVPGYRVRVDLHPPGESKEMPGGCGESRSFVTDAQACAPMTTMDIEGSLEMWREDDPDGGPVVQVNGPGHYQVSGYSLNNGTLGISVDDQWHINFMDDGDFNYEITNLWLNSVGPEKISVDYED